MKEKQFLETERLIVKIHTEEQYINAFNTLSDEALMKEMGFATTEMLETQKEKVKGGMSTYRTTFQVFQLVEKESQITVGNVSFHNWYPMHCRAEIGYMMNAEAYKNKGFMREAIKEIVHYGFSDLGLNRIEALIGPNNIASQKLVERLNFKREGYLKEHWRIEEQFDDSIIYGLLRKEYFNKL